MKTKLLLPILCVAAIALGLWMWKGKSPGSTSLGQPSLELTNEIPAYGPRPPGSEALAKVYHLPLNLVGIPTIDIIGDFANKPWWHTPADNAALISAESLDISIRVTLRMLDELLRKQ